MPEIKDREAVKARLQEYIKLENKIKEHRCKQESLERELKTLLEEDCEYTFILDDTELEVYTFGGEPEVFVHGPGEDGRIVL